MVEITKERYEELLKAEKECSTLKLQLEEYREELYKYPEGTD